MASLEKTVANDNSITGARHNRSNIPTSPPYFSTIVDLAASAQTIGTRPKGATRIGKKINYSR